MQLSNIENLPKGALRDEPDDRDYKIHALGAALPPAINWNEPYSVPEPDNEDQGTSDACVSYACSYYHENLKPDKKFSRRDLFARIALTYGAYLRDGILGIVKQGQATRDEVNDPANPTAQNMRDKTSIDPSEQIDDRVMDGFVIPANDIDTCAAAIKAYGGVLFGVDGTNEGWKNLLEPRPPLPTDNTLWGHALYAKGYHLHNGIKCIIAKSSWCNSGVSEHHIKHEYFISNHTFNPWTLIPRKEIMTNSLIVQNGAEFGIYDPATSEDGLITLMRNRGMEVPLTPEGKLDWSKIKVAKQLT